MIIESSSYHNGPYGDYGRYGDETGVYYDYNYNQDVVSSDIYNIDTPANNLYNSDYYYSGNEEFVYL